MSVHVCGGGAESNKYKCVGGGDGDGAESIRQPEKWMKNEEREKLKWTRKKKTLPYVDSYMRERYDNNKRTCQQKRDFVLLELKATRRSLTLK